MEGELNATYETENSLCFDEEIYQVGLAFFVYRIGIQLKPSERRGIEGFQELSGKVMCEALVQYRSPKRNESSMLLVNHSITLQLAFWAVPEKQNR